MDFFLRYILGILNVSKIRKYSVKVVSVVPPHPDDELSTKPTRCLQRLECYENDGRLLEAVLFNIAF